MYNRLFGWTYTLLTSLVSLVVVPVILIRGLFGDKRLLEYLGIYGDRVRDDCESIWVHASSVGEVKLAGLLIEQLHKTDPDCRLVLSVVTPSGRKLADAEIGSMAEIYYLPLDLNPCLKKAFRKIRPGKIVLTETELYPNFLKRALQANISLYLINGRISDRSYRKYQSVRELFGYLLKSFTLLIMQSEDDLERIVSLGADRLKCRTLPNLKYDLIKSQVEQIDPGRIRDKYGISQEKKILTAGSTRDGEELRIAREYVKFNSSRDDLLLVIAPRHIERAHEIESCLKQAGLTFKLRSLLKQGETIDSDVLIVDTIGELTGFYSISSAAFVGGSLVPKGGQNPLEPVGLGVPTCFGPHMENFREIKKSLLEMKLAHQISEGSEVAGFFKSALDGTVSRPDPELLFKKYGRSAEITAGIITGDLNG
jgi:3-deoxy-D-manno-octulosonic-acid transferase